MLGQSAPHDTVQLPVETVQAVAPSLQTPADAPSSVEGVQLQAPQGSGGQPLVTQASRLMLQMPADVLSVVEGVQLQVPQQSSVWVCVFGGSQGSPPQAAGVRTCRDLVLLRSPFTQALQGDHPRQSPHTQSVAGRVPVAL